MKRDRWALLVEEHLQRYPKMTAQDVYKLLFQGILGPEHNIPTEELFISRLQEELSALQPDASQALIERIRPDGKLNRIHLRSWLATGLEFTKLVERCLEAARHPWGSPEAFSRIWQEFLQRVEAGDFPAISPTEAMTLDNWIRLEGYPAVHHSPIYSSLYKPAYRLIEALPMSKTKSRKGNA